MTNSNPSNPVKTALVNSNDWIWGFTSQAETWNGRFAMIGFVSALLIELFTHKGVLEFWGILSSGVVPPVS
jgi:hypothetical protein